MEKADNENKQPQSEQPGTPSTLPVIMFFLCIAALAVIEYSTLSLGYQSGLRSGHPGHNNILGLLVPVLGIAQLALLFRIGNSWGRASVAPSIATLLVITILQIPASYTAGRNYGESTRWSMRSRALSNLRTVAMALDSYNLANKGYPSTLNLLSPTYLPSLPKFGPPFGPLRFVVLDPKNVIANNKYLLWVPGSSEEFAIQEGSELKLALESWNGREPPAWLCDRTYDPTNGTSGTGDIWRIGIAK